MVRVNEKGEQFYYGKLRVLTARTMRRLFERRGINCLDIWYFGALPSRPVFDKVAWCEKRLSGSRIVPL